MGCSYPFERQNKEAYGQTQDECFQEERNDFSKLGSGIFLGVAAFAAEPARMLVFLAISYCIKTIMSQ